MRRRRSIRTQERDRRYVGSQMRREAVARRPRCGCPMAEPEADPALAACPCGEHCPEHREEAPDAR